LFIGYRRRRRRITRSALALCATAFALGGCSSPSGNPTSSAPSKEVTSTTVPMPRLPAAGYGGVVTWAEQASDVPAFIFPMNSAYFETSDLSDFQYLMYRSLYFFGTGASPTLNLAKSVGEAPVYSDGDTVVTVTIKPGWQWSNGEPVDAADVLLWMNMLAIEAPPGPDDSAHYGGRWGDYAPGFFPGNVGSITVNSPSSLTFNLTSTVNPLWFTYNELSQITPLPLAWDRTSLGAAAGSGGCSTTAYTAATNSQCIAVFNFLTAQSMNTSAYVGSPLWSVVDGPFTLDSFDTVTGDVRFVPNDAFTGGPPPYISAFVELGFTTDTSEFHALEASSAVDVGYMPANDLPPNTSGDAFGGPNVPALAARYSLEVSYLYVYSYWVPNLYNPDVGPIFRQLYAREAIQSLMDQPLWIRQYDDGYGLPGDGPVPTVPGTWASPGLSTDPFPYSPSRARELLSSHGWAVRPGGSSSCARPGSGPSECGAGITRGESFRFTLVGDEVSAAFPAQEAQEAQMVSAEGSGAGITIQLAGPPDTILPPVYSPCVTGGTCNRFMAVDFYGEGWVYLPDYLPTGEQLFLCKGTDPRTATQYDDSSYCDAEVDALITASTRSRGVQVLYAYENYVQKQGFVPAG
jgi:peptide/nickel transport system substrate-binding protein